MTEKTFLSHVICVFLVFSSIYAQESCQTPDDKPGTCVLIKDCKKLDDLLLNKYRTPSETRYLRNCQCGKEGEETKVCCENTTTRIACFTPENDQGECINIYKCQPLANLLKRPKPVPEAILTYLKQTKCEGNERFSVCCSGKVPNFTEERIQVITTPRPKIDTADLLPDICGSESVTDRIFGGNETGIGKYPWMAIVEYRNPYGRILQSCGASLISKRFLVTAAHCVQGAILREIGIPVNVRLGEYDRSNAGADCERVAGGQTCSDEPVVIPIDKYIAHPQFEKKTAPKNDIAVIKLTKDAPFTDYIFPICLPNAELKTKSGTGTIKYTVAGWGTTEKGGSSNVMMHLTIPSIDQTACQKAYTDSKTIADLWEKQICAGGSEGKDSCRGDSGGPLMFNTVDGFVLAGVVSFGPTPCGQEGIPGVYSKVLSYRSWILEQMASQ